MSQDDEAMGVDDAARSAPVVAGPRFEELKRSFVSALRACVEPPTAQVRGKVFVYVGDAFVVPPATRVRAFAGVYVSRLTCD